MVTAVPLPTPRTIAGRPSIVLATIVSSIRTGWDSNPRDPHRAYTLSRRAPSAARAPVQYYSCDFSSLMRAVSFWYRSRVSQKVGWSPREHPCPKAKANSKLAINLRSSASSWSSSASRSIRTVRDSNPGDPSQAWSLSRRLHSTALPTVQLFVTPLIGREGKTSWDPGWCLHRPEPSGRSIASSPGRGAGAILV